MGNAKYPWGFEVDDPVLNHPILQVQADHKQLGQVAYVLPQAKHSRFNHFGFVKYITDRICRQLEEKGDFIGSRNNVVQFAKIHDMGHPPFSHAVEYVLRDLTKVDHNERALQLLGSNKKDKSGRTLPDVLEFSGACVNFLKEMLEGKRIEAKIVTDKSIGADKLAYTFMDADLCDFYQTPPDWERLIPFLRFIDDYGVDLRKTPKQVIDQTALLTAMQYFYFKMYTEVYLSPESMAYERHLQKAVELAIRAEVLSAEEVWDLGDDTLLNKINNGNHSNVEKNYLAQEAKEVLQGLIMRDPYVSILALKYTGIKKEQVRGQKVIEIEKRFKDEFLNTFKNPLRLTELESAIANDIKGIPVLCCLLPDPEKVVPTDVPLYDAGKKITTLRTESKGHFHALEEMRDEHFAIRLRVPPSEAELAGRQADKIVASFFEHSKKIINRSKKPEENLEDKIKIS